MKTVMAFLALASPLTANLIITEVMSSSENPDGTANGDWWELTNQGTTAINLSDYSWDDNGATSGQLIFPTFSLAAGASVIILNEDSAEPFRAFWNLPLTQQIFVRSDFAGPANGDLPGFSSSGDAVTLFNPSGTIIDQPSFGGATPGATFFRFRDEMTASAQITRVSVAGELGATNSSGNPADIGSPGSTIETPPAVAPIFTGTTSLTWVIGQNQPIPNFQINTTDANDDAITLTATTKPNWLTLNDLGDGRATLSGTPSTNDAGTATLIVAASDGALTTEQTYEVNIAPSNSPIILNEYNGVSSTGFLGGSTSTTPNEDRDFNLGRIEGNGGEWVEFIVVGNGSSDNTVDLRGWTLTISSDTAQSTLKFSQHPAWAEVIAGTILTLGREGTPETNLHRRSELNSSGILWSHVRMDHPTLFDQSASTLTNEAIGSNNTRFTIQDNTDAVIYGPSGESVAVLDSDNNNIGDEFIGVGSSEAFRLERNPTPTISPINLDYDDGTNSTLGGPNRWGSGPTIQSFSVYQNPTGTPPTISGSPSLFASRGEYEASFSVTPSAALELVESPNFLSLAADGLTLMNNRALTVADIGSYPITLSAPSPGNLPATFFTYELHVLNPAPAVILNEYNAVSNDRFLGGSTSTSSDTTFGRIEGNGGDWVEFVIVGDGTPGEIDLRGWTFEIGTLTNSNQFSSTDTFTLTQNLYWASVPHGTILTFIERNTADGGRDTQLSSGMNISSRGWDWTNVFLGDSELVTGTGLDDISISSNNTLFRILDQNGTLIFGPAGEGIAPLSGVSDEEILELEDDPSPDISSADIESDTTDGYDDSDSGSTFGAPNSFVAAGSTADQTQDFSAYALNPYSRWLRSFGLTIVGDDVDTDQDGATDIEEFLLGGDPTDSNSKPLVTIDASTGSITFDIRTNSELFPTPVAERSENLINWFTDELEITANSASPIGFSYVRRTVQFEGTEPRMFFRAFSDARLPE